MAQTLVRLAFQLAPPLHEELKSLLQENGLPLLAQHGFTAASGAGRPTVPDVCATLFAIDEVSEFADRREALRSDDSWRHLLQEWGSRFDRAGSDGMMEYRVELYCAPAGAGKTQPTVETGNWRTYDATDGLGSGFVWDVLQDRDGYIWCACYGGGVARFDGHSFQKFTAKEGLAHNEVSCAFEGADGRLWFGTEGGISVYDGDRFETMTSEHGLAHNEVADIFQDAGGDIWFCTENGVSRYDGERFHNLNSDDGLVDDHVSCGLQDRNGHYWFGTEGGLSRYNGHIFTAYTRREGLPDNWIRSVFEDREGTIWAGTNDGGVCRFDGADFAVITESDGLPNNGVLGIMQDTEGDYWFCTFRGVARYDGHRFTATYTEVDGLANNRTWSAIQDREGQYWFGTLSGVSCYDGNTFASFRTADPSKENSVLAIVQDRKGCMWFGPWGGGITRYDGEAFTTFTADDGLCEDIIFSAVEDQHGRLWFGTWDSGAACYDGETFQYYTTSDGLINNRVWSMLADSKGNIWFCTAPQAAGSRGGVTRYDGESFYSFTVDEGLAHDRVRRVIEDRDGIMWFATFGGLSRYDGTSMTTVDGDRGVPSDSIWALVEDREGGLWLGTSGGGACRYDGESCQSFTTEHGLPSDDIWSMCEDQAGSIWIGTSGAGVGRFDGRVIQTMSAADGLAGNMVQSFCACHGGYVWIGTNAGLTRYRPPVAFPPPVFIDAVVAGRRYEGETEIEFESSVGLVAFEFHAMSFKTLPKSLLYRCRLKGFDDDWHPVRDGRVEYQDLPPGAYTFEVVAVDRDLVYSQEVATRTLTVTADTRDEQIDELEQRVRERTRALEDSQTQLVQSEKMAALGNLVAGIAHEINNPVGAMSSAADIVGRGLVRLRELLDDDGSDHNPQVAKVMGLLEGNNQNVIVAGNRVAEVVRSLKNFARLDEAPFQKADLRDGLESTLTLLKRDMGVRITVERKFADIPQIMCYASELNQVFMNLLANAVQNTVGEGTVTVETLARDGHVFVRISDTGKGIPAQNLERIFDPGFTTHGVGVGVGLGLSTSYNIVRKHGGTIEVESEVGVGSTFTIRLPERTSGQT